MADETKIGRAAAEAASEHFPQTLLVETLLAASVIDESAVANRCEPGSSEERVVYEWHFFPRLDSQDLRAVENAGIPVLRSKLGNWVGFDSFGSPYDLYVRPAVASAIAGRPVGTRELVAAREAGPG